MINFETLVSAGECTMASLPTVEECNQLDGGHNTCCDGGSLLGCASSVFLLQGLRRDQDMEWHGPYTVLTTSSNSVIMIKDKKRCKKKVNGQRLKLKVRDTIS